MTAAERRGSPALFAGAAAGPTGDALAEHVAKPSSSPTTTPRPSLPGGAVSLVYGRRA